MMEWMQRSREQYHRNETETWRKRHKKEQQEGLKNLMTLLKSNLDQQSWLQPTLLRYFFHKVVS